ncbi:MAG: restriction endonuclease subunit S [Methylococcales bacterium]
MSEWEKVQLKELAEIRVSNVDKKIHNGKSLVKLCNYMDVYSNDFITKNIPFQIGSADNRELARFSLKINDVIITKDSESPDDIAIPAVVKENIDNLVCGYHLAILRPFTNKLDGTFLMYKLSHFELKKHFFRAANGSTRYGLVISDIENASFKYPVFIDEQQKIAHILSTVDAVIEKTEAAIAKYKAIKAGMMHDLFTRGITENGQLRPSYQQAPHLYKPSKLGWIPKEWEISSIEKSNVQIIDGDRGSNYPHEDELFEHGYCLFLNASNVTINGFVFLSKMFISEEKENVLGSGKLERYDIVITTRGTVGNIAFYSDNVQFEHLRINSGMLILRNNEQGMFSEFLFQSFKNYLFDIDYRRVVSGSAQPQLPMKDLKSFHLIKPDEIEQLKIINICKHHDSLLNSEIIYLEKMNQLKQGLMQDLLTGKVKVNPNTHSERPLC